MTKVQNYCSDEKNFKVPVMKAVEQVLGKSKLKGHETSQARLCRVRITAAIRSPIK
jgi:hypothetical protein